MTNEPSGTKSNESVQTGEPAGGLSHSRRSEYLIRTDSAGLNLKEALPSAGDTEILAGSVVTNPRTLPEPNGSLNIASIGQSFDSQLRSKSIACKSELSILHHLAFGKEISEFLERVGCF